MGQRKTLQERLLYRAEILGYPKPELLKEAASALDAKDTRIKELEKALEPFAEYLNGAAFDLDDKGNPLPDEQGMGWVYLNVGDFRRARTALKGAQRNG